MASLGRLHLWPRALKQRWVPLTEETRGSVGQSWDRSQVEDDLEEGDAMDWLKEDEMMRQWEEVSKEDYDVKE